MTTPTTPTRRPARVPDDARRSAPPARTVADALFDDPPSAAASTESAPEPTPARAGGTFAISVVLEGFPIVATFSGQADLLPAAIARLRAIGATPPNQKHEWSYTPDGLPICPKHGAPMRKRERQGDTWFSHVVTGAGGEDLYCRGYHGKDSPGYEC